MNNKKRYNIAVLSGGIDAHLPHEIIDGIRDAASELDVNIYIFFGAHIQSFFKHLMGEDVGNVYDYHCDTIYYNSFLCGIDGVIINYGALRNYMENIDFNAFVDMFKPLPVVILNEAVEHPNCYYLVCDNYQGMRLIMEHLIEVHEYQKILYVSGPKNNTDSEERKQAYLDAMAENALPVDESMLAYGDYSEFVDEQVEMLLDRHPDAEAIVFANDEMAFSGYRVCARRGLQVGRDIAITGYDNYVRAGNMNPPLTTVSQECYSLGRQSLFDMMDRLNGRIVCSKHLPIKYKQRESCGCIYVGEKSETTYQTMSRERNRLLGKVSNMQQTNLTYQRQLWFVPFFSRDLSNYMYDEKDYYEHIMKNLQRMSSRNMFLFLFETPVRYKQGDTWIPQEKLYLAACHRNGEVVSYYPYDRPVIHREHTMSAYINDEKAHQYTFYLLFSEERQYGLLVCDIEHAESPFFYTISVQLGQSLRYQEVCKIEAAHQQEMARQMELISKKNHDLDVIACFDELTGLLNLRGFSERVKKLRQKKKKVHAYMLYGDLDHLKEINDNWGHSEGDFAICAVADVLKNSLMDEDIVARIGGDEFVAMMISDTPYLDAIIRKRVKKACNRLNQSSDKPYYVEISLGIVAFDFTADTNIQEIISQADTVLYKNKKNCRHSVRRKAEKKIRTAECDD
jgi:diguanylate cyclase (GGDEF)-like protein